VLSGVTAWTPCGQEAGLARTTSGIVNADSGAVLAPAKINLTLEILAKRADGYHALRSVMVPLGIADELRWEPADRFTFRCTQPDLTDDNIVVKALAAIGLGEVPLAMTLEKRLPVGGGLGGGSSDGAAILRAAAAGAFGPVAPFDAVAVARALGSDVPFFLAETGALVEATGERVTPLGALPPWWVVLAKPPVHVATGPMFGALDEARGDAYESRPRSESVSLRLGEALQRGDFATVLALAHNDFEPIACSRYPLIALTLGVLRFAGARLAMLSGSGACCFALCETESEARGVYAKAAVTSPVPIEIVPFANAESWRSPSPA
jgi:4-diphosphocytidyl-2-C-methyl-D-erythritol kinase